MTVTLNDLLTDAQVSESLALEAVNASTRVLSGSPDEAAHLQAAEDLLTHATKVRTVIDQFWASVPNNAWNWDEYDMVSVRGVA